MKLIKICFSSVIIQIASILFVVAGISLLLYCGIKNNLISKFEYPDQILIIFLLTSAISLFGVLFARKKDKNKFEYFLRQPWRNVLVSQMVTIFILNTICYIASKIYSEGNMGLFILSLYNASAIFGVIIVITELVALLAQFKIE